ncbi:MAG TPA: hypothetical protein VJB82_00215 [Candidatus Peribacterales bacterium]|nr:hypothetical protein [Candidatus Peribacterales bacterium]
MKKSPLMIGLGILLLVGVTATALFFSGIFGKNDTETALTPQAQTERLTSFFLLRKIKRLRDRAVYIQHREEGRKLLELSGIPLTPANSAESSSSSGSALPTSSL